MSKIGFKPSASLLELHRKAQMTGELTKQLIIKTGNFSIFFSIFMANSKGKDKFIALFQYLFEFCCMCGKHSNIPEMARAYKNQELRDMVVYYNLKESLSSARKVFRLFRFFDEIKGLTKILKTDKPIGFKILSVITYFCSIMYYLSDNILWFLSILVKSEVIQKSTSKTWKYRKNFFSFWRVIAYGFILVYSLYLQNKQLNAHNVYLKGQTEENQDLNNQNKSYAKILEGRRKQRFLYLEMCLSVLRFMMLTKSLRLRGHKNLDPIFIGLIGLISAILGFLKALFEKKIVINLQTDAQKQNHRASRVVSFSKLNKISQLPSSKLLW